MYIVYSMAITGCKGTAAIPALVIVLLCTMLAGCAQDTSDAQQTRDSIRQHLIGYELTYTNIAGQPMTETIASQDIDSIELTYYDEELAWIAVVKDGLWYIYFDEGGSSILYVQQNFVT